MAQINRTGALHFHDASLHIWEEPECSVFGEWERQFKKDVFLRMAQQLRRLGWRTEVPPEMVETYSRSFAEQHRYCRKGDLQGFLDLSGRHIEFMMWQDVANVSNPNGGRYDFDKEQRMPYLLRLEMQRTRNRLRDYLCNVFAGYEFSSNKGDGRSEKRGPGGLTAMQFVQACWESSWHFKGDTSTYEISDYNRNSADGQLIEHGQRIYFTDRKGRMCTGTAYYNINNMWWVVSGKYSASNKASFELYANNPGSLRVKRNKRHRRKRLEGELSTAIKAMDFKRAQVLKEILFPTDEPLFLIWHKGHSAWFAPDFNGYRNNANDAGKYTRSELGRYIEESDLTKAVPLEAAA
ncbi:hypothetical protein CUU95_18395 [Vreelandella alkaliphila]|uniref:hypothetical protein n=1 Tax=Vreelandella alkaliphila TaxID=272774 RepID=UPI000EA0CF03|nr:hypothetical protein [Halomonas alkaliphila]AYF32319.1 hypothetical protein CUU95_00075 [Halomonas alkaliphila]AYF35661.1 hypothetical protein CUU95_18395 [Halomonas alkaliphila]